MIVSIHKKKTKAGRWRKLGKVALQANGALPFRRGIPPGGGPYNGAFPRWRYMIEDWR